jgi:Na+-transporting NADH:ubiquinone oxidoreductase subunit C
MFSNRYIFIYSSVMVIIVALLLSVTATVLQPYQQKNLEVEKMKDILGSAHIKAETANVPDAYKKYVTEEIVIDENGNQISLYTNGQFTEGNIRAFDINIKEQLHSMSKTGKAQFPLYVIDKKGEIFMSYPYLAEVCGDRFGEPLH